MTKVFYKKTSGFTLMELLISIVIMTFISSFTAQSLRTAMINSKRIRKDVDVSNELRAALRLIKMDLRKSFNHRDLYIALYNEAQREHIRQWKEEQEKKQKRKRKQELNPPPTEGFPSGALPQTNPEKEVLDEPPPPPPEYKPRKERIVTQFLGEKDKVEFSSLNGNTIRKGSYISDLTEVAYEVKNCQSWGKEKSVVPCLWRRLSYYLDGDLKEGGQELVLLENVTSFTLRYLYLDSYGEVKWEERWVSSSDGPSWSRNKLPQGVEITLEVQKPKNKEDTKSKTIKMVSYAPIDFVNNSYIKKITQMNNQPHPLEKNSFDYSKKKIEPKDSQGGI